MKFELVSSTKFSINFTLYSLMLVLFKNILNLYDICIFTNFFFFLKKFKILNLKLKKFSFSQNILAQRDSLKTMFDKNKFFPTIEFSALIPLKTLKSNLETAHEEYLYDTDDVLTLDSAQLLPIFKSANGLIRFFMFKLFSLFNQSFAISIFTGNAFFSFYSIFSIGKKILILNYKFLLTRWLISYDFLFNLSYFKITKLFFTAPLFKQQNLALNWETNSWTLELWAYFRLMFIFKDPQYSPKINFFFSQLYIRNINCAVISDIIYHTKNVFYLKKNDYFTVGLLNITENPFLLDYPIIAHFRNHLIQMFFLKFIIFIERQSQFNRFIYWQQIWFNNKYHYFF